MRGTTAEILAGVIGGIVATQVNDVVETVFWRATPEREKAREPETPDDSSADAAARKLLERVKEKPSETQHEAVKKSIHFGLGAAWGPLYCWLRRNTHLTPTAAGITSGVALSLIVDEALNPMLRITPPPHAYPASSHVRGLATHVVWGLVCGAVAEPLRRASPSRRRPVDQAEERSRHVEHTRIKRTCARPLGHNQRHRSGNGRARHETNERVENR